MLLNSATSIENINELVPQTVCWQSPSNIALVKYWGKFGEQYPCNPSISFTLKNAFTETSLSYRAKTASEMQKSISLNFSFEGKKNDLFAKKIVAFFEKITPIFPFIKQLHFAISSNNSFPHSSGIASSASSMSALALCLCDVENQLFKTLQNKVFFIQKASYIARLGSGSASRSVYPKMALWGKLETLEQSTNDYAIVFNNYHNVFKDFQDTILIVSKAEKKVSSRAGHALMNDNPYAETRYKQASQHLQTLLEALSKGDLDVFIQIVENEALILHALMMCSTPSFILMQPNTLTIIQKIRAFRAETKLPICFTLDAGPNVHVLYPKNIADKAMLFIKNELAQYCENAYIIEDEVGNGAEKMVNQ
ncbi:MAG: diphosphomevalonate/mevalonate 3,5-bisphosphate decarboxylase family protein [Chitinophagales bacterium]